MSDKTVMTAWDDPGIRGAQDWVFDLDNTLYPATCNLFHQVDLRMGGFISELLSISYDEARVLQKGYFRQHGTTLRGLMDNHNVDPNAFLSFVHDIDYSPVPANAALNKALAGLPGRKLIFTNGTVAHAEAVLERLGIAAHFDGIFDIAAADYVPKPSAAPYHQMVAAHTVTPTRAVMVEDIAKNLKVPAEMGMRTVWVKTDHAWSGDGASEDFVHHETDDLTTWLTDLVAALERA
ncbi:MAG: pyrimidine 5'-nucleotidase [Alphaproteobacteria bacterium]|nr:pyrimidine 5'-nucleotidase [Alphaproteobacteria bacterium]